jgi:hypothetical protein
MGGVSAIAKDYRATSRAANMGRGDPYRSKQEAPHPVGERLSLANWVWQMFDGL